MGSAPVFDQFPAGGKTPSALASQSFPGFQESAARTPASRTQIKRATNCAIPGYLILNHYSTKFVRLKDYSVCGHLCGQSRFYTAFGNRGKSSKRRCRKALRRFDLPRPGYNHGTPKCGTIPTPPYPDRGGGTPPDHGRRTLTISDFLRSCKGEISRSERPSEPPHGR